MQHLKGTSEHVLLLSQLIGPKEGCHNSQTETSLDIFMFPPKDTQVLVTNGTNKLCNACIAYKLW